MAFVQAATKGSCTVYWNGDTSLPISSSSFGVITSPLNTGATGIGTPRRLQFMLRLEF